MTQVGAVEAASGEVGENRVREQQGVELHRIGVAHPGAPAARGAAVVGAEEGVQTVLEALVGARHEAGSESVDAVLIRRCERQAGAAHAAFRQHRLPVARGFGGQVTEDRRLAQGAAGGEEHVGRPVGAQRQVEAAAAAAGSQDLPPGLATVRRAPHAGAGGGVDAPGVVGADLEVVDEVEVAAGGRRQVDEILTVARASMLSSELSLPKSWGTSFDLTISLAQVVSGADHISPRESAAPVQVDGAPVVGVRRCWRRMRCTSAIARG